MAETSRRKGQLERGYTNLFKYCTWRTVLGSRTLSHTWRRSWSRPWTSPSTRRTCTESGPGGSRGRRRRAPRRPPKNLVRTRFPRKTLDRAPATSLQNLASAFTIGLVINLTGDSARPRCYSAPGTANVCSRGRSAGTAGSKRTTANVCSREMAGGHGRPTGQRAARSQARQALFTDVLGSNPHPEALANVAPRTSSPLNGIHCKRLQPDAASHLAIAASKPRAPSGPYQTRPHPALHGPHSGR
jgi:hypothetical protein